MPDLGRTETGDQREQGQPLDGADFHGRKLKGSPPLARVESNLSKQREKLG